MNRFLLRRLARPMLLASVLALPTALKPVQAAEPPVQALVYSTMPSATAHRPEMALDNDPKTYFKSYYGMSGGDDFEVFFTRPLPLRSIRVLSGDAEGQDTLSSGMVETSADGTTFRQVAAFNAAGVAESRLNGQPVSALRIRLGRGSAPALVLREIQLGSLLQPSRVLLGPGRAFSDISRAPDLAAWAARAERQMQESWADTQAMLYSPGFITPNKVNVIYRTGPGVTGVAAYGGGEMEVNADWSRKHPEDTPLTVHEVAHVIQAMSAYDPVWLIEGVADYIRWVKFEPQNHHPRLNPATASYKDSYRTTATFLGWCELHYDSALVLKLNHAIRFGNYKPELWKQFTGKDVDTLWSEFLVDYRKDPEALLATPTSLADRPRDLPAVAANSSTPVSLAPYFNAIGLTSDAATFDAGAGFDAGGASFSSNLLGASPEWKNVRWTLGTPGANNIVSATGQEVALPAGKFGSLWILGAAVEGNQMAQTFVIRYADGTSQEVAQNMSDWYQPRNFVGEARAVKMDYRNLANGARDPRTFFAYSYGFKLDPAKEAKSITLPSNPKVKIMAISVAR